MTQLIPGRITSLLRLYYRSHFNVTLLRAHMVALLLLLPYIIATFIIVFAITAITISC